MHGAGHVDLYLYIGGRDVNSKNVVHQLKIIYCKLMCILCTCISCVPLGSSIIFSG